MSNYNDLIELRNRLLNDDLTVFEEDCQLLDRVLDDYEQKDQRIAELEKENGYIIFADGYDENGNKINKQVYVKYKEKCEELRKENEDLLKDYAFYKTKFYDKKRDCEMLQQVKNELEEEKQTAVKEFAEEILKNISEETLDSYQFESGESEREILNRTRNYILELLKERGIYGEIDTLL